jgi:hypothetical protein
MLDFFEQGISSWEDFYNFVFKLNSFKPHGWIYRGQSKDWKLSTAIECMLRGWAIDLTNATTIEFQTIREFRRRLRDPQYSRVQNDTLFCLALMQHHGAPTRLLDCSYSPFAALHLQWKRARRKGRSSGVFDNYGWRTKQGKRRPIKICSIGGMMIAKEPMTHFLSCTNCTG